MTLKYLIAMAAKNLILLTALVTVSACATDWEKHKIEIDVARELIDRYRQTSGGKEDLKSFFRNNDIDFITANSSGVRYYFGLNAGKNYLILVGTSKAADDADRHDDIESKIIVSPAYNGQVRIPVDQASLLTQQYQARYPAPTNNKGGFYHIGIFDYVKAAPGYSGINFYYGREQNGETKSVGFATRLESQDSDTHVDITGPEARIMDMSVPCPRDCGRRNTLNNL